MKTIEQKAKECLANLQSYTGGWEQTFIEGYMNGHKDSSDSYLRSEVNRLNNVIADRDRGLDEKNIEIDSLHNLLFWMSNSNYWE